MNIRVPAILCGLTLLATLNGCSITFKSTYEMPPSPMYDPVKPASIIDLSANYCRALAKTQGADFTTCFKRQTDFAIKQMQEQRLATPNLMR